MDKKNKPDREYITSLERGLAVLRCFSRETPELSISEIAAITDLNPAVVRRCLHTLVHLGYIGRKGKMFLLRAQVMSLASAYLEAINVEEAFRPALQELSNKTGDSTALAVLIDHEITFLLYVSTAPTINYYVGVGKRLPAYLTALGRALLAWQPKEQLESFLKDLEITIHTDKTVTSVAKLRNILNNARKHGYVCAHGELDPMITSIAMPVFSAEGNVVAAINCSTSTTRSDRAGMIEHRVGPLQEAAKKVEMELRRFPILSLSINSSP